MRELGENLTPGKDGAGAAGYRQPGEHPWSMILQF